MNKEDMLDVLIKAFGIYLLVLAIIAIPKAIASINFLRSGSWVRMLINKPTSHPE